MGWNDDDEDEVPGDFFEEPVRPKKKIKYPKCYVDKKHDGDPICRQCALELYEALPKKKFKYPRNCWNCEENGVTSTEDETVEEEPFYEE